MKNSLLFLLLFLCGCTKEDGVDFTEYATPVNYIIYREDCDASPIYIRYAIRNKRNQMVLIDTIVRGDFALTLMIPVTAIYEEIPLVLEWESDIATKTVTQIICNGKSVASNRDGDCRFSEGPGSTWCKLSRYYDPPE